MTICKKCVTPDAFPGIKFNEDGICNRCIEYSSKKEKNSLPIFTKEDLKSQLQKLKNPANKYDVVVPLSGGVDSSVVLIELVRDYGLRVLAFHNDHGYEPEIATENVRNLCRELEVDIVIEQKDYRFMKKLWKHVNQSDIKGLNCCFVCGNIIYANSLAIAKKYNIPVVINGYSKGQAKLIQDKNTGLVWMGELIHEITEKGDIEFIDEFLNRMKSLKKQKILTKIEDFSISEQKEETLIVPFYMFKFNRTDKEILKGVCREAFDWKQPENTYPGRTTNCTMNWLNNHFDIKRLGYSNYHEEYSVLVRAGEITREQALADLEFRPPQGLLEALAKDVEIDL